MLKALIASSLLLSLGCTHPLDRFSSLERDRRNQEARAALAAIDFAGAQAAYQAVLDSDPSDTEAAFGLVLCDLLRLAESPPVEAFLDRANQPRANLARDVFGPSGVLSQLGSSLDARVSNFSIHHRMSDTAGWTDLDFNPQSLRAQIDTINTADGSKKQIAISIGGYTTDGERWLTIYFNPDDLLRGDDQITPIGDGVAVPIDPAPGLRHAGLSVELRDQRDLRGSAGLGRQLRPALLPLRRRQHR
jgi:hypothetical protein